MSRDIKFRVWDKILQEYFSWEDSVKYNNYHHLMEDGFDACVLEQFTGFKDINGIELYEGDVLQDADTGFVVGVVTFNSEYGEYYCGDNNLYDCLDCQIIGDMHRNKELVEDN